MLDDLDRVYDWDCSAAELYTILISAAGALNDSRFATAFQLAANEVGKVAALRLSKDEERSLAIERTDGLRRLIAEELRLDKKENPKGRHQWGYWNSE